MKVIGSQLKRFKGTDSFFNYLSSIKAELNNVGATETTTTVNDATIQTLTSSSSSLIYVNESAEITLTSLTPTIVSIVDNSIVPLIDSSIAVVKLKKPFKKPIKFTYITDYSQPTVENNVTGWVTGSLSKHIHAAISAMVTAKSSAYTKWHDGGGFDINNNTQAFFTAHNNDSATLSVTRNPNLFTGSLDWSAVTVHISGTGRDYGCFPIELIHPRIAICGHVAPAVGSTCYWKDTLGNYQSSTVQEVYRIPHPTSGSLTMSYLVLLSTSVTVTNITLFKLLPTSCTAKLKYLSRATDLYSLHRTPVPCLVKARGGGLGPFIGSFGYVNIYTGMRETVNGQYLAITQSTANGGYYTVPTTAPVLEDAFKSWSWNIQGGDSNGPVIVPIDPAAGTNYQPVIVSCTNTYGGGEWFPFYNQVIVDKMESWIAGSTAGIFIDLTNFNTY